MKKLLLASVTLFFIGTNLVNAALPIGGYVGVRGGTSIKNQEENKDSFRIDSDYLPFASVNAGVRVLDFRGELEYIYRYNNQKIDFSTSEKDVSTSSLMANLYYNFLELPFVRLYVNGGLGYSKFSTNYIEDDKNLSYSLGFGGSFTLAEAFSLDVGYRYFDMGHVKILEEKSHFYSNDLYVGIRVGF